MVVWCRHLWLLMVPRHAVPLVSWCRHRYPKTANTAWQLQLLMPFSWQLLVLQMKQTPVCFVCYFICLTKGRLHHRSLNLRSTERVQRLELVQFCVQVICVAQQIFELVLLNSSLNHDLCRSPNLMNSYWLIEHTDTLTGRHSDVNKERRRNHGTKMSASATQGSHNES